jgi:hypothetical protein
MSDNMPIGYPSRGDFPPERVSHIPDTERHWDRHPGSGGRNYGENFAVPSGTMLVGWSVLEHSRFGMKGQPVQYVVMEQRGILNVPKGVHVGCRLEPGSLGGGGASYKYTVQMWVVTEADWYAFVERRLRSTQGLSSIVTSSSDVA